jgi:hypothetical protein
MFMSEPGELYPHTLEWQGSHIFLVTTLGGVEQRRDLGTSSILQTAYQRWKHLKTEHSRAEANCFLWGLLTGLQAALMAEIDGIIHQGSPPPKPLPPTPEI